MRDYIKRFLIAGIMAVCVSLLFLGGRHLQAAGLDTKELTEHWIWPSDGVVTDTYGTRDGEHKGIDIAGELNSPIYSVDNGMVVKSYYSQTYGNVIFIKHPNDLETIYAHLSERNVTEGQKIKQGELIGKMGNTGESSGVHLHFEVHQSEWTYEKENAMNPILALGMAEIGTVVKAFAGKASEEILAASTKLHAEVDSLKELSAFELKEKSNIHVVQARETLWSISQKYHSTVEKIKMKNQLNGNTIRVGQILTIPYDGTPFYIVESGDTLLSISKRLQLSVTKIMELNGLNTDIIIPNQVLIIEKPV